MASRTMELRLRVKYFYDDSPDRMPEEDDCKALLDSLVSYAANRGLLSGESDLCVDDYRHEIHTVAVGSEL
jgi:hypothetical protein